MGKDPNILESRKVFTNVLKSPLSTMDRLGTKKISLIMFQRGEERDKKKRKNGNMWRKKRCTYYMTNGGRMWMGRKMVGFFFRSFLSTRQSWDGEQPVGFAGDRWLLVVVSSQMIITVCHSSEVNLGAKIRSGFYDLKKKKQMVENARKGRRLVASITN